MPPRVNQPFVADRYDRSRGIRRLSDLSREDARFRAQMALDEGDRSAQLGMTLAQIGGQLAGAIVEAPGRKRAAEAEAKRQAFADAQMARAERGMADDQAIQDVQRKLPIDPRTGRPRAEDVAREAQLIDPIKAEQWWKTADEEKKLQAFQAQTQLEGLNRLVLQVEMDSKKLDPRAKQEVLNRGIEEAIQSGYLTPEQAEPYRALNPSLLSKAKSELSKNLDILKEFNEYGKPRDPLKGGPGDIYRDPETFEVLAENAPKPPEPPAAGSIAAFAAETDPVKRAQMLKDKAAFESAGRAPTQGPQPQYMWSRNPQTGAVELMTTDEIRSTGGEQPPTADMRNKQVGKAMAAKAVEAVRTLGEGIITKVGPAQRVDAIKRGAEAVFGLDPEFRTYQDSRMALAGTLAVEQQGSRVSDADVKALWLPMIPDAYRDTSESYKLKWDLINAMRGVPDAAPAARPGSAPKANPFRRP